MSNLRLVMDVESSGSEADKGSFPVSIGVAGPEGRSWGRIICPLEYWTHWDDAAEELHGLSRDKLIDDGHDPFLVCRSMNLEFKGQTLLIDAVSDKRWVDKLFNDVGVQRAFEIMIITDVFDADVVAAIYEEALERVFPNNSQEDARIMYQIIQEIAP